MERLRKAHVLVVGGYQVRFALLDTARSVWQKITD